MKARAKVLRADYKAERGTVVLIEVTPRLDAELPELSLRDAELLQWARREGGINPFDLELPER